MMSANYSPEKIDTSILNPDNLECIVIEQDARPIKYVRADCIEKYAFNDGLKDGQQRWVFYRESWFLATVSIYKNGLVNFSVGNHYCGDSFSSDDPNLLEIGPVLRAPKHAPTKREN